MTPQITICGKPLNFVCGVAFAQTFAGRRLRVLQNGSKRFNSSFGYILYDFDNSVLKRCPACSAYAIGQVVIQN